MSEEKKKIKRIPIDKLLASYFVNREIFMKRVYTVRIDPAKENKYMIITSEGFELYNASKKVDGDIEVLDGVELFSKYLWEDFNSVDVDKFAIHTHYQFNTGLSIRIDTHNDLTNQLQKHNIKVNIVDRKWYNKILGYRSQKKWKMVFASFVYLFSIALGIGVIVGSMGEEDQTKGVTVSTENKTTEIAPKKENPKSENKEKKVESSTKKKETPKETSTDVLNEFNDVKTVLMGSDSNIKDMDIKDGGGYYAISIILAETAWANSNESQKMSFVTSLSQSLNRVSKKAIFYDVYSNTNQDKIATTGMSGRWDIKR